MAQQEVPLIGPMTLDPQVGLPLNRQVFYLWSGIDGQARALIDFIAKQPELKNARVAVVYPQSEINAKVFEGIKDQSKKDALNAPQAIEYLRGRFDATETVRQLKQTDRAVVFLLGGEDVLSFMKEAEKLTWFPSLFLPGGSASKEVLIKARRA